MVVVRKEGFPHSAYIQLACDSVRGRLEGDNNATEVGLGSGSSGVSRGV